MGFSRVALWFLKRKYKKQIQIIKNKHHVTDDRALTMILGDNLNKQKTKVLIVIVILIMVSIAFLITVTYMLMSILLNININTLVMAGNLSIETLDKLEVGGTGEGWKWGELEEHAGDLESPGGLYPMDPKIRLRAELLEILKKSSDDANSINGIRVEPAWVLGTLYRETGNRLFNSINNSKLSSLYKELVIMSPACGKSSCSYISSGNSHFLGGRIENRVDKGDPYTQIINMDKRVYDGDHAVGHFQFEMPGAYGELNRLFGNTNAVMGADYINTAKDKVRMDESLGFIRPNPMHIPDEVYSITFVMANVPTNCGSFCPRNNPSRYSSILKSEDFNLISKYNQDFIKFMYASAGYGRGHIEGTDDDMALALIKLAKSGKAEYLDELLVEDIDKYWNSGSMTWKGNMNAAARDINSRYGLNIPEGRVSWYGVYAGCMGKLAYMGIGDQVASAEKEGISVGVGSSPNGNWVGHPGSGIFGNSGSQYYLEDIGIRWYHQTYDETVYSSTWGNLKIGGYTSKRTPYPAGGRRYEATMTSGGCGIYTLAMIASNLYDKDITPDTALAAIKGSHVNAMLADSGVPILANKLGLKTKTLNFTRPDIMNRVEQELLKGNMILFVSVKGPYPWYNGNGHFMAIRGMTSDGKLLGISSVGNSSAKMSAQELMSVAIEPDIWLKSLSKIRNYVWVVGIDVD